MKSRRSKIFRNKFFSFGMMMLVLLFISACGSSSVAPADSSGSGDSRTSSVTLLQTTDMHSRASGVGPFLSYSPMNTADGDTVLGGFARLAAKITEIRDAKTTAGSAVLLVDSGDYSMGAVYDFLWNTNPAALQFFEAMEYDLITLGNHEFDYGPAKLATMITASQSAAGFSVPIVASNTVFSMASVDDNALEALQTSGAIVPTFVKTLPNGLKIGFIGLIGSSANTDSPNAPPVTFRWDYAAADKAYVQGIVNNLRTVQGANVVIALSHSGINPGATPTGDDVTLAQNITGIDIIASGHEHAMTPAIIDIPNTATPSNITHIICAGSFGTNLAQLDFTATATGVTGLVLTNHTINDTILGDDAMNTMVLAMNSDVNNISGIPLITEVEQTMGAFPLAEISPGESGLGNMIADSLRFAGKNGPEVIISAFARGEIFDSFSANEQITFANLFSVVPLGITKATDQGNSFPGYPLLKVYLKGDDIWRMCKFDNLIRLTGLFAEDFVHLSGIQFTFNNTLGVITSVKTYAYNDYKCTGATTGDVADTTAVTYPIIIDSYVMAMLLDPTIQGLLNAFVGGHIYPTKVDGTTLISASNMMDIDTRLDSSGAGGVQEFYAWSALLDYFTSSIASGGLSGAAIPADPYDFSTTTHKRIIITP